MTQAKLRSVRSASTKSRIQAKAKVRGGERSEEVRERVRAMMATIEKEMADNEGIYPHNKGALSSAELARRSDVHPTTFFSPQQRVFGTEVKAWVEGLKASKVVGRGPVRREMATRVADWKRLYDDLSQSHRDTELDLQQVNAELAQARDALEKIGRENARLQSTLAEVGGTKVVPLRTKKD